MAKYDDASWHYEGEYPNDIPRANAATHIGMFLTWCIHNELISDEQIEDSYEDIQKVKNRSMTGAEFLMNNCDEKFTDDDLNTIGNKFAKAYYEDSKPTKFAKQYSSFLKDYATILNNSLMNVDLYRVENSWANYNLIKPLIDQRFIEWKQLLKKKM
jgi:hypothetical protein